MPKALVVTPAIKAAIIRSTGDAEFDTSKVTVFETVSLNTMPLNKSGSIFHKAVHTAATLDEMAAFVKGGGFVPLHTLHAQGYELPVGRVFDAEVLNGDNGLPELRSQFFVDNEHSTIVSGVDTGSIEEVSVGILHQHLNCSVCGFDYRGEEATMDNIYSRTCANDHELHVDGTHLILSGMERWGEQSLVSLGAAHKAKIVSRTKSLMGAESYEKLAASGFVPEATVLLTQSPLSPIKKPEPKMEIKDLVALNATLSGEKAVALHEVTVMKATNTTLTETNATLTTKVTELEGKLAAVPAESTKAVADLAAANTAMTAQLTYIRTEANRLCVAANVAKLADTATFEELTASIDANRVKLQAAFGGGKAQDAAAGSGAEKVGTQATASAYKAK